VTPESLNTGTPVAPAPDGGTVPGGGSAPDGGAASRGRPGKKLATPTGAGR
jgi:hypothetical protein